MPDALFNRVADNWRPLFAIAEVAAGDWPKRCSEAFARLTDAPNDDVESLRILLLGDIQKIFDGRWPPLADGEQPSPEERKFSRDLVEVLTQMRERPWPDLLRGKPINERWLAKHLAAFGIHPKLLRIGDDWRPGRGYEKADFEDAFMRYLPEIRVSSVTPLQREGKRDKTIRYKSENVTDQKPLGT
jgi:hypothetical protein